MSVTALATCAARMDPGLRRDDEERDRIVLSALVAGPAALDG
jgi:hypothetical protein